MNLWELYELELLSKIKWSIQNELSDCKLRMACSFRCEATNGVTLYWIREGILAHFIHSKTQPSAAG